MSPMSLLKDRDLHLLVLDHGCSARPPGLACLAAALGPLACLAAALGPLACLAAGTRPQPPI